MIFRVKKKKKNLFFAVIYIWQNQFQKYAIHDFIIKNQKLYSLLLFIFRAVKWASFSNLPGNRVAVFLSGNI